MFGKILVANRGEIAGRIIQTCREMGIVAVAVYSEADANALHVRLAEEAYCIGPAPALESYLSIPTIIDVALKANVDAVHPGYGFLAENADFARAVTDSGMTWIGPPSDVIALLGDKVAAKSLAQEAGVPIIPGYAGADLSSSRLCREAEHVGFPIMLKAAAGGGGRGMRVVHRTEELAGALESARREAQAAFGDDRIFLEALLEQPRHIEIQVLVDTHGNAVYLGERECSLQRRHQKVVEEAPSPVMTDALRTAMGESALRLCRAAGYTNAGTVEFLFSQDRYYFLEVNTRIQVEHPVTELVTGLDLVREQIQIAAGSRLGITQLGVELKGHAIEVRLNAEDPEHGFLPVSGAIQRFSPPAGAGVRNDVGVTDGGDVLPYYDSLMAKLIVHAPTRPAAVNRLRDALERYVALGVTTNLSFLQWVSRQQWFEDGRMDTGTIERLWRHRPEPIPDNVLVAAAAFEASRSDASTFGAVTSPWFRSNGWRAGGVARTFDYEYDGVVRRVRLARLGGEAWQVDVGGMSRDVSVASVSGGEVIIREGAIVWTAVVSDEADIQVLHRGIVYRLTHPQRTATVARVAGSKESLTTSMPGTVVKVAVREGQHVTAHEPLVVLEAMKMEHVIEAPHDGIVRELLYQEGDLVPANQPVVRLEQT